MKLEQQVVSLELAKKLKELGVKQESIYFWRGVSNNARPEPENWYYSYYLVSSDEKVPEAFNNARLRFYSAFTVAELGEMLSTKDNHNTIRCTNAINQWGCDYEGYRTLADTEADARAKMLIYLLENKLITL